MKTSVIIAAGGSASRLGIDGGKQLMEIKKIPVVVRSCQFFQKDKDISEIVVVIAAADVDLMKQYVDDYNLTKVTSVVFSGDSRQDSVLNGFNVIKKCDVVMIHDGARPFPPEGIVQDLLASLDDYDGAVTAVKVTDTIKVVAANDQIIDTPNRNNLYAAQTPQAFKYGILQKAYSLTEKQTYTDDASMVESVGGKVCVVTGNQDNIKITYQKDIVVAEEILERL